MLEPANVAHDEYDDRLVILMMIMMTMMMLMMAFFFYATPRQEERHDTPSGFHLDASPMTPYTRRLRVCKTP